MFQRTNTIVFCIYFLFASATIARHTHRRPLHRHAPRSETTSSAIVANDEPQQIPSSTLDAPSPSFTASDAVLDDIVKIQSGLNDLPEDLLAIISSLEHRLAEIEKVLAGYLDSPAMPTSTNFPNPVGPIGPVLSPAPPAEETSPPTDSPLEPPSTVTVTIQSDPPATTPPAITTTTSFTRTRSTRITRTLTLMTTVPAPLATDINGNETLPVVSGTRSFTPPAPSPRPYLVSSFATSVEVSSAVVDSDAGSGVAGGSPTSTS